MLYKYGSVIAKLRYNHGARVAIIALLWLLLISLMHHHLNAEESGRKQITMGYMPVITNLASPILDYATKEGDGLRFKALKFSSFAEMAESLRNGQIDAAFIIAPLAVELRQQGEDVKVVYIGNRHESTLVAKKSLNASSLEDLAGKTIAVPMRYSGHNLSLLQQLEEKNLQGKINIVEMNPPDMASALSTGALDAYFVGEPFAAQTLQAGESDLIYHVEDVWKGFICNLTVVRQSLIESDRQAVQHLVESAARSGIWAKQNLAEASAVASKYWNQKPELIEYALNTPDNRIVFDSFKPVQQEMQAIADLMHKYGLSDNTDISGLVDDRFAKAVNIENISDLRSIIFRDL
ncbi:MAG: ABC transporter substrate-binding protein [Gammaproteobacteria bacterium]|nr:ABC transporter substrate-binding protein [Gammaproteobacteria bacterium]